MVHLLTMFREDFEFHDAAGPSHHGGHAPKPLDGAPEAQASAAERGSMPLEDAPPAPTPPSDVMIWLGEAERELKKIPFFVRGKARRNTEKYAADRGVNEISKETLYEAKAHYAR